MLIIKPTPGSHWRREGMANRVRLTPINDPNRRL